MKIALINPPNKKEQYYDSSHSFSHLGLGYVAASLESSGYEVDYYETYLQGISQKEIIEILIKNEYCAIGFTAYYYNIFEIIRMASKIKKYFNPFIFVGGIYASTNCNDILINSCIDCCVLGEGEVTVINLMESLRKKNDWRDIMGIAYSAPNGIIASKRGCVDILDNLPFPQRPYILKNKIVSMIASRGCNGNCSFCGIRSYYSEFTTTNIRIRSTKNVVEEIKHLVKNQNIDYIYFQDENFFSIFNIDVTWAHRFCELILRENLEFKFYLYARADDIVNHESILKELKKSGLQCVFVGIESFIDRQLKLFNKRTTREINLQALQILKENSFNFIIGFIPLDPFITMEELFENISTLLSSKFYENSFFGQTPISCLSPLFPMPMTNIYKLLNEKKLYKPEILHKYIFQDTKIQSFYEELESWRNGIRKEYEIIDNRYKNTDYISIENQKLLEELRNLLKKDIEFLYDLCYSRAR